MILEMIAPSPGESITEMHIWKWLKKSGDYILKDEEIVQVAFDKTTFTILAEGSGVLKILAAEGDIVSVGSVICKIDMSLKAPINSPSQNEAL